MDILHIVPSLDKHTGGPASSVLMLCHGLAKLGVKVSIFTTKSLAENSLDNAWHKNVDLDGYKISYFNLRYLWFAKSVATSKALWSKLSESWNSYDLIHVHGIWNPISTFAMKILREKGARYCLSPHGMLVPMLISLNRFKKSSWLFLWERANIAQAQLVHFTTTVEQEKAMRTGLHFRRTVVIPNLLDLSYWKNLPPRKDFESMVPGIIGREVILFVGRINWIKNLDKLIQAMAIVCRDRPSAMLVCVGPDSDNHRSKLERQAFNLGIHDHVLFTGMLTGNSLKTAYARADLLALVSKHENFGMVIAEALACGVPVVLSEDLDIVKEIPMGGPILPVRPTPPEIAKGIIFMLDQSKQIGLPDPRAKAIPQKLWGMDQAQKYIASYSTLLGNE